MNTEVRWGASRKERT